MKKVLVMMAAILAQAYYLIKNCLSRQKHRKLIALIATMKVLSPGQLAKKVNEIKQSRYFQLCKAKIYASEACHSVLKPETKVVYSSLLEGPFNPAPVRSNLLRITEPSYMILKQGADSIRLFQTHKSIIFPTRMIKFKVRSWWQKLIGMIKNMFSESKKGEPLKMNDFYHHQNVYQLFLPEGSECTILGNFSKEGGEIVCSRPKMIFQSEKQMVTFIQQSIRSLNVVNVMLIIGFVLCTLILLKQAYKMIKLYRQQSKSDKVFDRIRKIFLKERVCSLCKKNLSCVYNMKCQHMVICQECINKPANACLQCNEKERDYVQMYVC